MASFRVFAVFLVIVILAFDEMVEGWKKESKKGWGKGGKKGKKSSESSSSESSSHESSSESCEEGGLCEEVKSLLELTECPSCQNPHGKWKKKCKDAQTMLDCITEALCDADPTPEPSTTPGPCDPSCPSECRSVADCPFPQQIGSQNCHWSDICCAI